MQRFTHISFLVSIINNIFKIIFHKLLFYPVNYNLLTLIYLLYQFINKIIISLSNKNKKNRLLKLYNFIPNINGSIL